MATFAQVNHAPTLVGAILLFVPMVVAWWCIITGLVRLFMTLGIPYNIQSFRIERMRRKLEGENIYGGSTIEGDSVTVIVTRRLRKFIVIVLARQPLLLSAVLLSSSPLPLIPHPDPSHLRRLYPRPTTPAPLHHLFPGQ